MSILFVAFGLALVALVAAWALIGTRFLQARKTLRYVVLLLAVLLASAPLSVLLTLFLIPFWRWLEATYGIQSIGHSGPEDWCYVVTFLMSLVMLGWGGLRMAKSRSDDGAA